VGPAPQPRVLAHGPHLGPGHDRQLRLATDTYTLADYLDATASLDVRGVVWSDPGAADPVAAAAWVAEQDTAGRVTGLVGLVDPASPDFEQIVTALHGNRLVTSIRIRVSAAFGTGAAAGADHLLDAVAVLDDRGLVATLETSADQLPRVGDVARRHPGLQIVLDHFGWPADLSDAGRQAHLAGLERLADESHISTRIDAIGTIFGAWHVDTIRPWLVGVVDAFGPARCMLGSDFPIETLRSTFGDLYSAYDVIFESYSDDDRRMLFADTARRIYGRNRDDLSGVGAVR
jgi:predicted TIM-barrel fold metal-dependent hydrolase